MITTDDYFVRLIDLPPRVRGITVPNEDGTYSIYINARLSFPMQRDAYDHEVRHLVLNHLYTERPIEIIEAEADGLILDEIDIDDRLQTTRPRPAPRQKMIPCYNSLKDLELYLKSLNALSTPIEDLGEKLW